MDVRSILRVAPPRADHRHEDHAACTTTSPPRSRGSRTIVLSIALAVSGIGGLAPAAAMAQDAATAGFFDSSYVHSVSVTVDPEDYAAAITAYQADETKEWLDVTAVIDGVTYDHVGMRLKGNSSLRGLSGDRRGFPGGNDATDDR